MINAQDIKIGTAIRMDGKLYFCIDFLHVKPGKGNTFMRTKLKDVVNGYVLERRFNIGEKIGRCTCGTSSTPIFVYGRCRLYFL